MIWKFIPAELAHKLAPLGLSVYASFITRETPEWKNFTWKGLDFKNRLGLAGGVDKNGDSLVDWQKMGAGFLEVGTVTPQPQKQNPGQIIQRDWSNKNLWNKMGFPSEGADEILFNLKSDRPLLRVPIFVNIGKNRQTPNESAQNDYIYLLEKLESVADVFVVNISSPNTPGLRELQRPEKVRELVKTLLSRTKKPLLVKLSPDLGSQDLSDVLKACIEAGVNGFVLTNTTTERGETANFPQEGGVSGEFLKEKSKQMLKDTVKILGDQKKELLLVSVGGISTAEEVQERIDLGADLVQAYSALVFNGPLFFFRTIDKINHV